MLNDLKELAYRANSGTSFSPEVRAEQTINEYTELLNSDLETIAAASLTIKDEYITRFKKYLRHYLSAKSRCISPMIAGPSNFPVRQQQKYHNWEDSAYSRFKEWRNKAIKAICKQIEKDKPADQKTNEAWESIKKFIEYKAQAIVDIDNGAPYSRHLFVTSLTNFVKKMAKNGQVEHVKRALMLIKELNAAAIKPLITEKNAIFNLELIEVAAEIKADQIAAKEKENDIFTFEGGEVVLNYGLNRLQIKHNSKPGYEVIQALKKNGFKWSPREVAWQRFLTNESKYKAMDLTGVKFT